MKIYALANINSNNNGLSMAKLPAKETPASASFQQTELSNVYYIHPSFMGAKEARLLKKGPVLNKGYRDITAKYPEMGIFEYLTGWYPPAIASYREKSSHEMYKEFLYEVTGNEALSKSFIEEITQNPLNSDENMKRLLGLFNNDKDLTKKVADNLEIEEHRWYEISTSVYKLEDGFVGIRGVSQIYSEGTTPEDCCTKCSASEYIEIPSVTYKRK